MENTIPEKILTQKQALNLANLKNHKENLEEELKFAETFRNKTKKDYTSLTLYEFDLLSDGFLEKVKNLKKQIKGAENNIARMLYMYSKS